VSAPAAGFGATALSSHAAALVEWARHKPLAAFVDGLVISI
jgi:hypothetical protein